MSNRQPLPNYIRISGRVYRLKDDRRPSPPQHLRFKGRTYRLALQQQPLPEKKPDVSLEQGFEMIAHAIDILRRKAEAQLRTGQFPGEVVWVVVEQHISKASDAVMLALDSYLHEGAGSVDVDTQLLKAKKEMKEAAKSVRGL